MLRRKLAYRRVGQRTNLWVWEVWWLRIRYSGTIVGIEDWFMRQVNR